MEKENSKFTLSFDNVKYIQFGKYAKDFTFIVNDNKYKTSRFFADILSPIVNKYHYNDETVNEINININFDQNKPQKEKDYFSDFLKLGTFNEQDIDEDHLKYYLEYFRQLGNTKEYLRLQQKFFDNFSNENIISKLKFIANQEQTIEEGDEIIDKMVNYISSNFEGIPKEEMKKLDIGILEMIINNDKLELQDEDSLLKFILELYEEDDKYSILFEYVIFKNVSESMLEKFIEIFDVENINSQIWYKITDRLIPKRDKNKYSKRYNNNNNNKRAEDDEEGEIIQIEHKKGDEFNGIMQYLNEQTGGNIHDNGTIKITSNSIFDNDARRQPKNLVDYKESNYYYSKHDVPNAYVCFDFKDKKVQLSSYSIKSYANNVNQWHLKNWNIEASDDGSEWVIIDEHKNDLSLNGNRLTATFNIQKVPNFYRFIRIHQTGTNTSNDYCMLFYCLEFYGKLKSLNNAN